MSRAPIILEHVRDPANHGPLTAFARSFDHELYPGHPAILARRGQRPVAYAQVLNLPLLLPGFHTDPQVCSPRDVAESAQAAVHVMQAQNTSGQVFALVPEQAGAFTEQVLRKMHFRPMGYRVFQFAPSFVS